jgi:heavy metal translocating P-type ATPase
MQKDKPVSLSQPLKAESNTHCLHCHDTLLASQAVFCCEACKMVYSILQAQNLGAYYPLRDETSEATTRFPKPLYIRDDINNQAPAHENMLPPGLHRFYVQGVHCTACLWLIEQLPLFIPALSSARMDMSTHTLSLNLNTDSDRNTIVRQLQQWGYKATWLAERGQEEGLASKERHHMLWRIGVAAFCSGNLMILSLASYTGIEGTLAHYFEWLSLLLALPVLLFSAWPFYQKGLVSALRTRRFSSDTPIALSLLLGGIGSGYALFLGNHQLYFDSLSMLVFLLLFSRYLLLRTQQKIWSESHPHFEAFHDKLARKTADGLEKVDLAAVQLGDHLRIFQGQTFAVDGKIISGHSRVDQALLTGEPYPLKVAPGDWVYQGTQNQQNALDIEVMARGDDTRLGKIIATARHFSAQKSRWIRTAETAAQILALSIVTLSLVLLFSFWDQPTVALSRFLALSIIACPCGLALATPLIFHLALKSALNQGIFVRHPHVLETLPTLKTLVFDKTGTLTQGRFDVLWTRADFFNTDACQAVLALESCSQHPVAASLVRYIQNQEPQAIPVVRNFQILPAGGIAGDVQDTAGVFHSWKIQPVAYEGAEQPELHLHVLRMDANANPELKTQIRLGDAIRPEVKPMIKQLQSAGYTVYMLSGDSKASCYQVARHLKIPLTHVFYGQTPEDKAQFLQDHDAIMIGDGINDLEALSCAKVGISVQGGLEENVSQSDIYLAEQGVLQLPEILRLAQHTRGLLLLTLGFALIYNLIAIGAATMGYITPLSAAILMPISALIVMAIAVGGQSPWKS